VLYFEEDPDEKRPFRYLVHEVWNIDIDNALCDTVNGEVKSTAEWFEFTKPVQLVSHQQLPGPQLAIGHNRGVKNTNSDQDLNPRSSPFVDVAY
jgi:hypothetical protein